MEMAYRERWEAEIAEMRRVLAGFAMKEECKWGKPTYTVDWKNSASRFTDERELQQKIEVDRLRSVAGASDQTCRLADRDGSSPGVRPGRRTGVPRPSAPCLSAPDGA